MGVYVYVRADRYDLNWPGAALGLVISWSGFGLFIIFVGGVGS